MLLHTFKMSDQIKNMTAKRCALKTGKRERKKRAPGEKYNGRDADEGKMFFVKK